jgi:uncharacterized protein (TIGR03435 family)
MTWVRHCVPLAGFAVALSLSALGQTNPSSLTYEIVSVRPTSPDADPDNAGISSLPNGVGYDAIGVTIRDMLSVMYRLPKRQIVGGPEWTHSERFDVRVRADHRYSIDDLHTMFQNALADRFHLKLHVESRMGPAYALTIAKTGLRMTPVDEGRDRNSPIHTDGEDEYTGDRVPLNYLCFWLGMKLQNDHRPVIDKTGLTAHYNFKLSFRPELPPDADAREAGNLPSIFDAVQDQLGLRLVPQRGPVQTLVIDRIDKPSEN